MNVCEILKYESEVVNCVVKKVFAQALALGIEPCSLRYSRN